MPDGFEPHTELARIYTLKELMTGCRQLVPEVMSVIRDALRDDSIVIRLKAADMVMDRGFGKPRQHTEVTIGDKGQRTYIGLPPNGRDDIPSGSVIDAIAV